MRRIVQLVYIFCLFCLIAGCDDANSSFVYRTTNGEPLSPEVVVRLAAQRGDLATLQSLLEAGVSPYQNLADDRSVLHHAAAFGQVDIITFLLDRGMPVNIRSFDRAHALQTPLYDAAQNNHLHAARLLLERGADPNALLRSGFARAETPYLAAAAEGHREMCELLLSYGANGAYTNADGVNALVAALQSDVATLSFVRFLVTNGADPNGMLYATSLYKRKSALYIAAECQHKDIYEYLIEQGADVMFTTGEGRTPASFWK